MKKCIFCFLLILAACGGGGGGGDSSGGVDCRFADVNTVSWTNVNDAELNTQITSNEVTVSGLGSGCTDPIFVTGSGDSYSINGGAFTSASGVVRDGDRVRIRLISASTHATQDSMFMLNRIWLVTTKPGRPEDAPTVTILSPTDQATVHASRIMVSGIATDPDSVLDIRVRINDEPLNGIKATSTDGFATWQAEVPLVSGTNVLRVSSTDTLLNVNPVAAEISIDNQATVLVSPKAIESDIPNQRLLAVDQSLRALLSIDLVTGQHSVLSDENTPDATTLFTDPKKLVVNSVGSTAWVLDSAYDDIIRVDLATGARSLVVDTIGGGTPQPFGGATDLVLDELNGRLLLVIGRDVDSQVFALDLFSGERTLLSDASTPDANVPFGSPESLALDTINNRLLVLQRDASAPGLTGNKILAIDPTTGQRTLLVDDSVSLPVPFNFPVDADFDGDNGRVLILSTLASLGVSQVLAFDLALDELTTLFSQTSVTGPNFGLPVQITRDPLNNRLLVLYAVGNIIGAIDFATGEVSIAY